MIPQISFILSCLFLNYSYPKIDAYFFKTSKRYGFLSEEKQVYVIKNVLKSLYLSIIVLFSFFMVIPDISYGIWDNTILQTFASLYVSNDIVGLYHVKLHTSTRLHHMTCAVFLLGAWSANFQESTTAKMLCIYTLFSAFTFPVNLYLGLRYVFEITNMKMVNLKKVSKWTYTVCCGLNWVIQLYMGIMNSELYMVVYGLGLLFILYDDIILLKWFFKN